jgi:hypothetical protein
MADETPPPIPPFDTMVISRTTGTTNEAAAMASVPCLKASTAGHAMFSAFVTYWT